MLLAIDIGNTNITLGIWDGQVWQQQWRLRTVHDKTADEYGIVLMALLHEADLTARIKQVIIASVVPPLTTTFDSVSRRYLQQEPLQVGSQLDVGIRIGTDNPAAVGVDRIVNVVAAYTILPGPSITIDMGTATKFDVVSRDGVFLGGVIAPGLQLTAEVLASRAAKLNQVALEAPPGIIGRNTIHAMQSGLVFGYVCMIEGMVKRILAEHPDRDEPIHVLGTGGLIHLIATATDVIDHVDPWLTLTGLRIIHDRIMGEKASERS